jgi:hypothetical protein
LLDFIDITILWGTFKIAFLMGLLNYVFFSAGTGFKAFFKGFVDACASAHDGLLEFGIKQLGHEFIGA